MYQIHILLHFLAVLVKVLCFYFVPFSQPEGPRKRKTKKQDKDPNQPKRPQSAYFLWLNDSRETIKKDNPGITITELSKKAGELWKEIGDKSVISFILFKSFR